MWDAQWYGGHHLPGYSVLFPPLARLARAARCSARWRSWRRRGCSSGSRGRASGPTRGSARRGSRSAPAPRCSAGASRSCSGSCRRWARCWCSHVVGGRSCRLRARARRAVGRRTCVRSATRPIGRRALPLVPVVGGAVALALLTALASPVAALFLALAGTAYALGARRRIGLAVAVAALAPVALLALAFPEGGTEPFVLLGLLAGARVRRRCARAAAARAARAADRRRALRAGCARRVRASRRRSAATSCGSARCAPARSRRSCCGRGARLALALPRAVPAVVAAGRRDPRRAHRERRPERPCRLLRAAARRAATRDGRRRAPRPRWRSPSRRLHWEARWVAPAIPLARGWERQLDREVNAALLRRRTAHAGPLPRLARPHGRALGRRPRRARSTTPRRDEARLIARGLPYLREVWRGAHWRLYEVARPGAARRPARARRRSSTPTRSRSPSRARRRCACASAGRPTGRSRAGDACVEPDGDWTRLRVRAPARVRLAMRFSPRADRRARRTLRRSDRREQRVTPIGCGASP